ncbi:MAG: autotransporter domain-containing protein [Rhizobiaceae bacterium]|nr:autotransporter domain-containing protein [Rhizobiaceae bacterium]
MANKKADLLVWMDLEMTGLDPRDCTIIEIATIITDGDDADGMGTAGHHSRLINYGTVITRADVSDAMSAYHDNINGTTRDATLENHGYVEVQGATSEAMNLNFDIDGGRILNHGTVYANGERSLGIGMGGKGHQVFENWGIVRVNPTFSGDSRARSLLLTWTVGAAANGNLKSVVLHDSSVMVGWAETKFPEFTRIRFGRGFTGALHFDATKVHADSQAYGLDDWRDLAQADELVGFHGTQAASSFATLSGSSFYAADLSDFAAQDHLTFDLTRSAAQAVAAPILDDDGGAASSTGCMPWISPFGGYLSHDGNDAYLGFDGAYGGIAAGCMLEMGIGIFAGGTYGQFDASDDDRFSSQRFGGFLGAYGATELQDSRLGYRLTLGYLHNDTERLVKDSLDFDDGMATLSGTHDSFYLNASLSIGAASEGLPEVTLGYTGVLHSEQDYLYDLPALGDRAYRLAADSRYSQSFDISSSYSIEVADNSAVKFGGGLSYLLGGDTDVTLMDTTFDMAGLVEHMVIHAFVSLQVEDTATMTLGGSIGEDSYSLSASARLHF